jgi:hypothetical protein
MGAEKRHGVVVRKKDTWVHRRFAPILTMALPGLLAERHLPKEFPP